MPMPVSKMYKVASKSKIFNTRSMSIVLFLAMYFRLLHPGNFGKSPTRDIDFVDFSKKVCYTTDSLKNMSITFTPSNMLLGHEQAKNLFKVSWNAKALHKELYPIAFLESNWNQNIDHERSVRGDFFTAFGPLGLKPVTAWEQFQKTAYIKKQYQNIYNQSDFENLFYNDTVFYNKIASAHWRTLRLRYNTILHAAFAWRWGPGAADAVEELALLEDEYVSRYQKKIEIVYQSPKKDVNFISVESAEITSDIQRSLSSNKYTKVDGHNDSKIYYVYGDRSWFLKKSHIQQQPFSGYKQFNHSTSRREYAFYCIAKVLGLGCFVPETHIISIGRQEWIASELLPNYKDFKSGRFSQETIKRVFKDKIDSGLIHKWAILDFIAGNPDRHAGNLLMNDSGDIKLIDHGASMCGKDFSPNNDYYSFVAYYLRFTNSNNYYYFSKTPFLEKMPEVPSDIDKDIRHWAMSIDPTLLESTVRDLGFEPETFLNRLRLVQNTEENVSFSGHINKLWVFV